jgi:hypothetical protein
MRPRHLPKRIIAKIEPAAFQAQPGNAGPAKPFGKAVRLEGARLEHAEIRVDIGDELILDIEPMPLQAGEHRGIDGNTVPFDTRRRRHGAAP